MEAEPLDLEDGEIINDEASDIETYNVLKRPPAASNKEEPPKIGYNDESDDSVDSESDSDSDSRHVRSKKPKLKLKRSRYSTKDWENKNNKYKIWCTQVQEDSLTEDLVLCGVTKKHYQERNVENYNVPHHYSVNGSWNMEQHNNNSSEDEKETERRLTNKRTNSDRRNVKLRLGKRCNAMDVDQKGAVRKVPDLSVTIESTDTDVATDIAEKLNESKNFLINRIVEIIGKEKAIDFFQETKKIEEVGGLLTINGCRRRTAGGVYLWLVKNDKHIPQEKIREIFYPKKKESVDQKKADASARRQKAQELIKCLENGSEKDLPALLTKAELSPKEIAEEARLRRGEGMDRMPVDSDRTVTNPPPSPVTDDPDHSEHSVQRHIQDYEEDYLDIGIDVDSMEVL
ncbi:phosphorylated adaptor for RNA export [Halictus rubicundus]|uniref:phosphorylated adaptor for RNA export n=1 Tax=Halictus rubicundus TaxID=77578 RepID=UPI0040353BA3